MEQEKLKENLLKYFDKNERQIVFWYNVNDDYEDKLLNITFDNVKVHQLTSTNNLFTKKLIELDDKNSNYIVYAKFEKPKLKENWLLDMLLYSEEFSVDEIATLCLKYGIYDAETKEVLKKHEKFWNNQRREKKFDSLRPSSLTPEGTYLTMFATILDCNTCNFNKIVRTFIIKSINGEDIDKEFSKYDLDDAFWDLINKYLGYKDKKNAELLLASIIFRNLQQLLSINKFPENYKKYTCGNVKESECNAFLQDWFEDATLKEDYKNISMKIEKDFTIPNYITDWADIKDNCPEYNALKLYDSYLIELFISSFATLRCEDKKCILKREKTLFFNEFKNTYRTLYWAIETNNLIKNQEIPDLRAEEFIKKYSTDYFKIDRAYRKFYHYYGQANNKNLDTIKEIVEKAYVNNYLNNISSKFSKQLQDLAIWQIPNVISQKDFYYSKLNEQIKKLKTIVIVSDALRYEVAEELMQKIKNNYSVKADIKLEYMLGSIPSYTKLGMAALLPHKEITMNEKKDILIDGISTAGSENREKILKAKNTDSKVLNLADFDDLNIDELNSIFINSGLRVAYVYHNLIDKTGENNEKDVFLAAEQTINGLVSKIEFIFNKGFAGNIIITADHGFLYQNSDLEEHHKISVNMSTAIEKNKRFVLDKSKINEAGVMNFDMKYILTNTDLYVSI